MTTSDKPAIRKPSGWKNDHVGSPFWIKSSKYGQKYKCKTCGRENLGIGRGHNHEHDCVHHVPREVPKPVIHEPLSADELAELRADVTLWVAIESSRVARLLATYDRDKP